MFYFLRGANLPGTIIQVTARSRLEVEQALLGLTVQARTQKAFTDLIFPLATFNKGKSPFLKVVLRILFKNSTLCLLIINKSMYS